MRFRLCLLLLGALTSVPVRAAVPPPRRDLAEVRAALAKAPPPPRSPRRLNVLLVANRKDHGAHEHDYPRWMERWKVLLGGRQAGSPPPTLYGLTADLPAGPKPGAARVTVETAAEWPTAEQFARADVVVAFMGTGGIWNEAKLRDLRSLLERGAGFVALHAAVIAEKPHARPLADLLGLAWEGGTTLFRHGPIDLKVANPRHPLLRGLPERMHFADESYWPLVGDASRVQVLATAEESVGGRLAPQPMFWTREMGKGRVFASILGHYTWTFDDPYFRMLTLRGIAWAAGESPYRFDPVVLAGARVTAGKPLAAEPAAPTPGPPVAPQAGDPDLLLWLDAAERVAATPDGRVTAWGSKATRTAARLSADGGQQPIRTASGLGGLPALRFDGVDDVLRDPAFRQASSEWTVALVVTPRSNAGEFRALMAAGAPGQNDYQTGFNIDLGPSGTPAFSSLNVEGIKGSGATNLRTGSAPFGGGQVLIITTGAGSTRLWVNGQEEEARGAGEQRTVIEELRLGGRFYLARERGYFHGDVSEVLLYRKRLSDAQRDGLGAHLMRKYGPEVQPPPAVALAPWDYLPAYDWNGTRRPLAPIDLAIGSARDARARKGLEARLIEVAADPANTRASRDFACRRLALIGSAASVPRLAVLLTDPALSSMAWFALERIPGREAERALIAALPRVDAIRALGSRRSRAAVGRLVPLLADREAGVRQTAAAALGGIGGPQAVAALLASEPGLAAAALLECAERDDALAGAVYERLRKPDAPPAARRAATRALILRGGAGAAPLLVEQLSAADPLAQTMALLLLRDVPGNDLVEAAAASLEEMPPEMSARILGVLADRGDPVALPAVRRALRSERPGVRVAAVRALGRLGEAPDVAALLAAAAEPDLLSAAAGALAALTGPGVDAALLRALERGSVPAAAALGRRGHAPSVPALVRAAQGEAAPLREAAIRALGEAAAVGDTPALVRIQLGASGGDAQAAEKALATLYDRVERKEAWADALLDGLAGARPEAKAALLRSLSLHGGAKVLTAVRSAARDPDPDVQAEALDLLCAWETPDAAPDLLAIAKTAPDAAHRTLALRGFLRLAGLPAVPAARRMEMCREGLTVASRDDERRLALSVLAGVPSVEALEAALPFLERAPLAEEAGAAVVAIAARLLPDHRAAVASATERVVKSVKNPEVLRQAADLRARAGE